jgi:hypothetical protein
MSFCLNVEGPTLINTYFLLIGVGENIYPDDRAYVLTFKPLSPDSASTTPTLHRPHQRGPST